MLDLDLGSFKIGKKHPLALFSGPCVIENESHALAAAENGRVAAGNGSRARPLLAAH